MDSENADTVHATVEPAAPTLRWKDLRIRVISGALAAIAALFCTVYSPLTFYALLLVIALLMHAEWIELTKWSPFLNRVGGLAYIGIPVWSMIALRDLGTSSYILFLFAIVWVTDTAAYLGGKMFGRHKLAPTISPGKTLEGLAIGVLCATFTGAVAALVVPHSIQAASAIAMLLAVVAQMGDLFESWLKRKAGVKDSGALLPGHGGILDRVDGLVFAAPVYAMLILF
jgi:phosphatidate cytidylyltransferase